MKLKFILKTLPQLQVLAMALLLAPAAVFAQATSWAGKYAGTIKAPNGDALQVTLELKDENGKLSGRATTPHGAYEVVKSTLTENLLTLELAAQGSTGKIAVRHKDDKLVGNWWLGDQNGALELTRVE